MKKESFWNIITIAKIYLLFVIFFFFYRLALFFLELDRLGENVSARDIIRAFIMGIRFDIVISGYILAVPFLLLTLHFLALKSNLFKKIVFYYIFTFFSLALFVVAADIPYFNQFYSRFTVQAFAWMDSPLFVFRMIVEEPRYWLYFIPFVLTIYLSYILLKRILFHQDNTTLFKPKIGLNIVFSLFTLGLILLGIRGRIDEKSPIRVGTAYFSNNPFLNQLGLNPNFTLIKSWLESRKEENQILQLMEPSVAISNVQHYLNIQNPNPDYPIKRAENQTGNPQYKNIVVVLMESMSAAKMNYFGNKDDLTPFLDSLVYQGIFFENNYSAGIHTHNGIFSTLFSFPALFDRHSMKVTSIPHYDGLARSLKKFDYSTVYFTTHDAQFDNVEGFLKGNDFDRIVSKPDYPSNKIKTTLGVPDDYLFEFSMPILNELHRKNKPFLSVFMTSSDHGPYYVPDYFHPNKLHNDIKKTATQFADYSLRKFIQLASKEEWFSNTLFVFIADHGASMNVNYNMALNYNHVPLLFYAPKIVEQPRIESKIAGQIDVAPSIMGFLELPYQNNTLGINLFQDSRSYIYFSADDKYGVIDEEWFLIEGKEKSSLHRYKEYDLTDYIDQEQERGERMRRYATSNLQTFQELLIKNKVGTRE